MRAAAAATAAAAALILPAGVARGVDASWKVDAVGNWSGASNWTSDPAVPNGVGDAARFLNAITANRTITQDVVGLTLGAMAFDDNNSYLISGANAITLDAAAGGDATVTYGTANGFAGHTIATDLVLSDNVSVTTAMSALGLTFSGVMSGSGGLVKTGPGKLFLSGATANSFSGDVTVNQGTLDMFKTVPLTVAFGGNLVVGDDVGGANADIAIARNGVIPDTSRVTVNSSGQFQVGSADVVGDLLIKGGSVTVAGGGGYVHIAGELTTLAHANQATISGTGNIDFPSAAALINVADGAAANDLLISAPIRSGGFNKQGAGKLVLSGSNFYPHATTISAGTLQIGDGGTTGTLGSIGVTNHATLAFNRSNFLLVSNSISGTGAVVQLGTGTTALTGGNSYTGTTTISAGTLQIGNGGTSGTLGNNSVTNNATLAFNRSNALTVANNISGIGSVAQIGTGTTTLAGALTYTGSTTASVGRLVLNTNLTTSQSVNATGTATVELANNGTHMRVIKAGSVTIDPGAKIDLKNNKLITDKPLGTFSGGAYSGIHGDIARAYNFGAWDMPGLTTSEDLADPTSGPLGGTTTIAVNKASEVLFIGASDTGVFAGQTVTGATTLAMYTYAGDVNLDGLVDAADYGVIDNWIQFPGTDGYMNGDFNYDGVIDAADYGIIDNTIQLQGTPIPVTGAPAELAGVTPVPEPAACGFALCAITVLTGRRRRQRAQGGSA